MSIFKRADQDDVQPTSAAHSPEMGALGDQPEQPERMMPPFMAPGVVPPPAAPLYSTRPPESGPRVEFDAEVALAGSAGLGRGGQQRTQEFVIEAARAGRRRELPAAVQRARAASGAQEEGNRVAQRSVSPRPAPRARLHHFDPAAAAQAGMLHLAWQWQQAGSPIRAIHTYLELLARHPGTPAAAAAIADLVALSDKLAEDGHFHIALGIYEELEALHEMGEEAC